MNEQQKLLLLKRILLLKVIVTFLVWGIPALMAPKSLFMFLNIPVPDNPLFLRLFGAVVVAFGVAYWYAYKDPMKNVAIIKVGIVDNGLVSLTIIILGLSVGITSLFIWVSCALTTLFFAAFLWLKPMDQT